MPRTIETTVYLYSELPNDKAKERARDWFRALDVWDSSDWWNSAQAFAAIAPVRIEAADYDRADVSCTWAGDDDVAALSGVRAWKWLANNGWFAWSEKERQGACTATGFCGDAPFADPIAGYATKPGRVPTVEQVFYEAAQAWVQEARADLEYMRSDEAVAETIEANGYEFTAEGRGV